jgi:hypothetical protein
MELHVGNNMKHLPITKNYYEDEVKVGAVTLEDQLWCVDV